MHPINSKGGSRKISVSTINLPLKEEPCLLGSIIERNRTRFLSLERRLNKGIKTQYAKFMDEFLSLDHLEVVHKPLLDKPHFYVLLTAYLNSLALPQS